MMLVQSELSPLRDIMGIVMINRRSVH